MKKLLLSSLFMIAISGIASAQTPEAVRAKKEAAKRDANQPALTTASQATAPASAVKTDAQVSKDQKKAAEIKEVKDTKEVKEVKQVKEVKEVNKSVIAPAKVKES